MLSSLHIWKHFDAKFTHLKMLFTGLHQVNLKINSRQFRGFSYGSMTTQGKKISMERNNSQTTKQKLSTIVSKYWETVHKVPIVTILHWIFYFFHIVEKGEKKTRTDSKWWTWKCSNLSQPVPTITARNTVQSLGHGSLQQKVSSSFTVFVDSDWHFDNLCGSYLWP